MPLVSGSIVDTSWKVSKSQNFTVLKKNITTCNKGLTRCLLFINLFEVYLFLMWYYLIHFLQYWKVHKAPITYIIKSVIHIVGLHHSSNLSIFLTNLSLLAVANRNSFGWNSTQLTAAVCCLKSWRSFPLVKSHNYRDKKHVIIRLDL